MPNTAPPFGDDPVADLISLLDLERIEVNLFRGQSPDDGVKRVFGGQVIAQALVAAYRTVDARVCHSLHAYFIRPGDPTVPILYEVDRSRDGKSFATRRVTAVQPSDKTLVSYFPALIIGSMVKNMPGCRTVRSAWGS